MRAFTLPLTWEGNQQSVVTSAIIDAKGLIVAPKVPNLWAADLVRHANDSEALRLRVEDLKRALLPCVCSLEEEVAACGESHPTVDRHGKIAEHARVVLEKATLPLLPSEYVALRKALSDLVFAASSRENTLGDPINLLFAREKLQQAITQAREVLEGGPR